MSTRKMFYVLLPIVVCALALCAVFFLKSGRTTDSGTDNVAKETVEAIIEPAEETEDRETGGVMILDTPGTYSEAEEYRELTIASADVVVENATAETLTIDAAVGDGDVTLKNMTVTNLYVYGGGSHSIHIEGVTAENMVVARKEQAVRVVVDAASSINTATLDEEAILEVEGRISALTVNAVSEVSVKGSVDTMNVVRAAKDSAVVVEGNVTNLVADVDLKNLTGRERVGSINVSETTENQTANADSTKKSSNKNKPLANQSGQSGKNGQNQNMIVEGEVIPPQGDGSGGTPGSQIVIERVQSEYAKVIVTLSAPTATPVKKDKISILCNSGGKDMTILDVKTSDNKVYEISTTVYKDNEYEIYMTLPDGTIISKVFEVRNDAPALTKAEVTRINEGSAEFFFVSDAKGSLYYLLEERTAGRAGGVPTAEKIKQEGKKVALAYQANTIRISGLKADVGYHLYYLAVSEDGKESLVQGPVSIPAAQAQKPSQNTVQIVDAKATDRYFDITLSGKPSEQLTLGHFSISCPATSELHLGRVERLSDTKYRIHMQDGYYFQDMNNYTITITYSDNTVSTYKFFVDLSWPSFSLPTVTRQSETEAIFEFRVDEPGTMWYICLDREIGDSGLTVDQVIQQGTRIEFIDGANRVSLNGVMATSKTLFYVYEDKFGNRPLFVDAVKIPETQVNPEPPQEGTAEITSLTVSKGMGPKNECTVLTLAFNYNVQDDQMYVSTDEIEIIQEGTSIIYTGYRDLEVVTDASGVKIKIVKNLGTVLPEGQYQIKVMLNKGTATKAFTVQP